MASPIGSGASSSEPRSAPVYQEATHRQRGVSRYELRAFGSRLQRVRSRMRRRGRDAETETLRTLWLVGPRRDVGLTVREGRLEVKRLLGRRHALEHWGVETVQPLPLDPDWARRHLPALLGLPQLPPIAEEPLPLREIALRVVLPSPGLEVVFVEAQRTRLRLGDARAEFARARVAGVSLETAAVMGIHAEAVRRAGLLVGLDPSYNTSWPEALRGLFLEGRPAAAPPEPASRQATRH